MFEYFVREVGMDKGVVQQRHSAYGVAPGSHVIRDGQVLVMITSQCFRIHALHVFGEVLPKASLRR